MRFPDFSVFSQHIEEVLHIVWQGGFERKRRFVFKLNHQLLTYKMAFRPIVERYQ